MHPEHDLEASPNRTAWLLLSYLWILGCCMILPAIPLVMEQQDAYAKWHAKHGLVLAFIWFAVSTVLLGMANLFGALDWNAGKVIFYVFWGLLGLPFLLFCLIALMKALEGHCWTVKPIESFLSKLPF